MKLYIVIVIFAITGCIARPIVQKRDLSDHERQNQIISKAVMEKAGTGDWLVIRGYHAVDNLVSNATGIPISHVGIYNSETRQVIEAEGKGIHLTTLDEFINKSYRLIIIRPRWQSSQNCDQAFKEAEKLVGKNYDFLGTVGFNYPNRYYCSELAIQIYKKWYRGNERFPKVIKPGELYLFGTILYDSLPRDEF